MYFSSLRKEKGESEIENKITHSTSYRYWLYVWIASVNFFCRRYISAKWLTASEHSGSIETTWEKIWRACERKRNESERGTKHRIQLLSLISWSIMTQQNTTNLVSAIITQRTHHSNQHKRTCITRERSARLFGGRQCQSIVLTRNACCHDHTEWVIVLMKWMGQSMDIA